MHCVSHPVLNGSVKRFLQHKIKIKTAATKLLLARGKLLNHCAGMENGPAIASHLKAG